MSSEAAAAGSAKRTAGDEDAAQRKKGKRQMTVLSTADLSKVSGVARSLSVGAVCSLVYGSLHFQRSFVCVCVCVCVCV